MSKTYLELDTLIAGFRLCCQTEAKSPVTIEWYVSALKRFRRYLTNNGMPTHLFSINRETIRAFIKYLQVEARVPRSGKRLSPSTVHAYVRTLKAFFSWIIREDYLEDNPMSKISLPKLPVKLVNSFDEGQIAKMLHECRLNHRSGYRDMTMIVVMLDTGVRISELLGMNTDDIDFDGGYIGIRHGKGDKQRLVPIGTLAQKVLWKFINQHRADPLTENIQKVFLGSTGIPITKNGVLQMMRRYGQRAGITGVRCSPHTLRHTFAKNYLLNGGDIFSLQKILGHSSMASVRVYLNLFAQDIKKQHRRFSPMDNMAENRNVSIVLR
jgi:integrase/recombinase XerD